MCIRDREEEETDRHAHVIPRQLSLETHRKLQTWILRGESLRRFRTWEPRARRGIDIPIREGGRQHGGATRARAHLASFPTPRSGAAA
eukprot:1192193-Pyramimonas_sp.AAC.1